ncbi:MAG TPA: response regulator [Solirubrobacteraceae bacterium]|nr:response regulator [Solirubrobacteraceae bacterium]
MARSLLIVDDDPAFRALARRMVSGTGLDVVGEADGAAAGAARADELEPDAILVDVGLPDGSGIDLAYELAGRPWRPRVVLVSSDPDAGPRPRGDGQPALPFVPKAELPNAPLDRLLRDG